MAAFSESGCIGFEGRHRRLTDAAPEAKWQNYVSFSEPTRKFSGISI
jgi:hypothetical protein